MREVKIPYQPDATFLVHSRRDEAIWSLGGESVKAVEAIPAMDRCVHPVRELTAGVIDIVCERDDVRFVGRRQMVAIPATNVPTEQATKILQAVSARYPQLAPFLAQARSLEMRQGVVLAHFSSDTVMAAAKLGLPAAMRLVEEVLTEVMGETVRFEPVYHRE